MSVWDEMKPVIASLREQQPDALARYPSLDSDLVRTPPIQVHLTPWAPRAAEELHRQFGESVELTVSSRPQLGYAVPPGEWGIQVTLKLGPDPRDSPRRRTPVLPVTITA
jgi:hypothetical protein